jgi:FixJ family two-component response regulator
MMTDRPVVFVVDDDARVRDALSSLLASAGLDVAAFASAGAFLEADKPDVPACLVLDLELPDISGLELQKELAEREAPPIRVHYWARRHTLVGQSHEGGSRRVPDEAVW